MAVHLCGSMCEAVSACVCLKAVIEVMPSFPSLSAGIQSLVISQGSLLYAVLALTVGVPNSGAGGASKTRGEGL